MSVPHEDDNYDFNDYADDVNESYGRIDNGTDFDEFNDYVHSIDDWNDEEIYPEDENSCQ